MLQEKDDNDNNNIVNIFPGPNNLLPGKTTVYWFYIKYNFDTMTFPPLLRYVTNSKYNTMILLISYSN